MEYASGNITGDTNSADTLAGFIDTELLAAGFDFVETVDSGTTRVKVYKSPAASNMENTDWYLYVRWITSSSTVLYLSVSEAWNTSTKLASRYVPFHPYPGSTGLTTGPAVDTANDYTFNGTANPASSSLTATGGMLWLAAQCDTTATQYQISSSLDRVVVSTKTDSNDRRCVYAGLLEEVVPTDVPGSGLQLGVFLVAGSYGNFRSIDTSSSGNQGLGNTTGGAHLNPLSSGVSNGTAGNAGRPNGGFTREPNSLTTHRGNFVGAIYTTGSFVGFDGGQDEAYSTDFYIASAIIVYSTRNYPGQTATNATITPRGILIDIYATRVLTHGTQFTIGDNIYSAVPHAPTNSNWSGLVLVGPAGS